MKYWVKKIGNNEYVVMYTTVEGLVYQNSLGMDKKQAIETCKDLNEMEKDY
jgi:hypothetical protein